jgi:hypothetical protein
MSYYRAALAAAANGDLTSARRCAAAALALERGNKNAEILWQACQDELDEVRRLKMKGCRLAVKRHYRAASRCFADAAARDAGDDFIQRALAAVAAKRSLF